ncbi:MAG TPA: hypothetical protein VF766_04880, partial [Pyrinomonadaceae bacterium]
LEQWETALSLNAERVKYKRQRGADEVEVARTRFNEYYSFLRLRRYTEARELLDYCRSVFELENAVYDLASVYGAMASLENTEGRSASAARFGQTALRYKYKGGEPEGCATSHHNLANYMARAEGGEPEVALAHRMAAGVIRLQINSGMLATTIRNLSISTLPPEPPSFTQVCDIVGQIEGVRFRELFAQLPKREPDGDAAIQAVWKMARAQAGRQNSGRAKAEALLAGLPEAVREAFLSGDKATFDAAIAQIVPEQQQAAMAAIEAAAKQMGFDPEQEGEHQMQEVLSNFEPLLQGIAAVARGDSQARAEIEESLLEVEEGGWKIADAVRRIWAGEREVDALTAGLDEEDSALVRRVLELVGETA